MRIVFRDQIYAASALLILILLVGLAIWKFNHFQVGAYHDDAQYTVIARSIAQGRQYGLDFGIGEILPTRYPFGWPLILAPIYSLSDGNLQALKSVAFVFTVANVLILLMGWRYLGFPNKYYGLAVAALCAVSPLFVSHAGMIMSEPAFLFFVLLSICLGVYLGRATRMSVPAALLLGIALTFSLFIRTIGITVIFAIVFYLFWNRRWLSVALAILASSLALTAVVSATTIEWKNLIDVAEYLKQYQDPVAWGQSGARIDLLPRMVQGFEIYFGSQIRDVLVPFFDGPTTQMLFDRMNLGFVPSLVNIVVIALIATGFISSARHVWYHPSLIYFLLYLTISIVWPWRNERFLYGILPFLVALMLEGGDVLLNWALSPKRVRIGWRSSTALFFLGLLLSFLVLRTALIESSLNHVMDFRIGAQWLRDNTAPDALIVAQYGEQTQIYAHRPAVHYPAEFEAIPGLSDERDIYVLITPIRRWNGDELTLSDRAIALGEALQTSREYSLVFLDEDAKVSIYRLNRPN